MTRTSVICLRSKKACLFSRPGYTLLEILFVMALIALVSGLVTPRLTTLYESVKRASERDLVLEDIAGLGFLAYRQGITFEIPASIEVEPLETSSQSLPPAPLELPEGWHIEAESSIRYDDNGVCTGGRLRLEYEGGGFDVLLRPPLCRPEIL